VSGTLVVVEPETIELSNLQRYVLTEDRHEGVPKGELISEYLRGTGLKVETVPTAWGDDGRSGPGAKVVLVAVDSAEARIGVQASLPERVYNAWTQLANLGWSRHEEFGNDPCLACLYMPTGQLPSRHQLIGSAIRQNDLRVLGYLISRTPVGLPLPAEVVQAPAGASLPPEATLWLTVPIIDDICTSLHIPRAELETWTSQPIDAFYRGAICGGVVVRDSTLMEDRDVVVPMAHQSALAGVMLATEFLAGRHPDLRRIRSSATEGHLDLRQGLPQIVRWPRNRTAGCICEDADYRALWQAPRS
jgi:hypothetical protein